MLADGKIALFAAAIALLPAWFMTRGLDPSQPGWAVRVYLELFRSADIPVLSNNESKRKRFLIREAFLATWFLVFFVIFAFGIFIWPEVPR